MLSDEEFYGEFEIGEKYRGGEILDEESFTGLEIVRSNASEVTKDVMKHALHVLLYEEDITEMDEYITKRWVAVLNGEVEWNMVGEPTGLQKTLASYGKGKNKRGKKKGTPPHAKAARYSNKWLGKNFGIADKPVIVFVKRVPRNFDKTLVIALDIDDEWPENFELDWEKQANKVIKMPLNNLLRGIGRPFEEVVSDVRSTSLTEFLGPMDGVGPEKTKKPSEKKKGKKRKRGQISK
jgi:DNA polymerase elongation subunit (family B)